MSKFLGPLELELLTDSTGLPLFNRDGRQLYRVLVDFGYSSDVAKQTFTVPKGFVTDLASVPRLPLIYDALGDMAQMPAVVHDYLYSTAPVPREVADKVLLEAMELTGISWVKRHAIYAGVRVGGGSHYGA